jgi:flagellar basal-body rod protein FlgC
MSLFNSLGISASALSAERLRMDVTAENLANAQTTRTEGGGPYKRKEVVLESAGRGGFASALAGAQGAASGGAASGGPDGGVRVSGIVEDTTPDRLVHDPSHPDADANGYVRMPNVNPVTEMVDLISASRSYEANVTAMQTAKQMFNRTLDILR